ncbi:MAG TPA: hypothetical protein VM469_07605 [Pseudoxanthomonas sp.]|nr:hypothetical protein [Pseudoxanthomonas sp.]
MVLWLYFLLSLLVVAALALANTHHQRANERSLQRTFDTLSFETAEGRRYGPDMQVVKQVTLEVSSQNHPLSAFWYCVGSGPSYFVAMAQYQREGWLGGRYEWTVRPLDEERMRHALIGDKQALQATFGTVEHGVLHA